MLDTESIVSVLSQYIRIITKSFVALLVIMVTTNFFLSQIFLLYINIIDHYCFTINLDNCLNSISDWHQKSDENLCGA